MSEFEVNVVKVDDVQEHPDADRLTIVSIGGFKCIANKKEDGSWRYQKGDLVVYIPEASLVPEWLLKKLGMWNEEKGQGMLAGSNGNRVKAIRLRGVVSQGILYPVDEETVPSEYTESTLAPTISNSEKSRRFYLHDNVAEFLGITKYEPPIPVSMSGQVGNLFGYTHGYDIENLQKYPDAIEDGTEVIMTEKLHGTYCEIGIINNMPQDDYDKAVANKDVTVLDEDTRTVCYVTSKGQAGKGLVQKNTDSNENNLYVKALNNNIDNVRKVVDSMNRLSGDQKADYRVYIKGEIYGIGVQDLGYGEKEQKFRVFDVFIVFGEHSYYANWENLQKFAEDNNFDLVDVLYEGSFSIEKANEMRTGNTVTGNAMNIREGIVIRPVKNISHYKLGNRVQLKYINEDYLLRKGGTENN